MHGGACSFGTAFVGTCARSDNFSMRTARTARAKLRLGGRLRYHQRRLRQKTTEGSPPSWPTRRPGRWQGQQRLPRRVIPRRRPEPQTLIERCRLWLLQLQARQLGIECRRAREGNSLDAESLRGHFFLADSVIVHVCSGTPSVVTQSAKKCFSPVLAVHGLSDGHFCDRCGGGSPACAV